MKVAITGGTGFLGKALIEKLLIKGYSPVILTRSNYLENNEIKYLKTDYSKSSLIKQLENIDAVVHLAAKRGSSNLITDFNYEQIMAQNLFEACKENSITNIVYASTISVYSNQSYLPWIEGGSEEEPVSMYGINKLTIEKMANYYNRKENMYIKSLRFAHLFGFNEKNNYMINLFLRQAYNKETIILHNKSADKREFLYVKEAARATISALEKTKEKGVFNVGSNESFSNLQVAQKINYVFGNIDNLKIEESNGALTSENSSYMDSRKFITVFDYKKKYDFVKSLEEIQVKMRELDYVPLWY